MHGLGVGEGQRKPGSDPARGTDRAERIGVDRRVDLAWFQSSPIV